MELNGLDKRDWQALYKTSRGVSNFEVQVELSDASSEVTQLRYFFPFANRLYREKRISSEQKLTLNIAFKEKNRKADGDEYGRVAAFLSQWEQTKYIQINVNGKPLVTSGWEKSRIFPLCSIASNSDPYKSYQVLNTSQYSGPEDETPDYFNMANMLIHAVKNAEYSGERQSRLNNPTKDALRKQVNDYINAHLDSMTVLAKIVWMYILLELINEKALYSVDDNPQINDALLKKSRIDAITYGEALYQLIENACLHSQGHRAWFGIRVHRAGRETTMSDFPQESKNRIELYERYRPCFTKANKNRSWADRDNIFNQDYRFYFEFYVLDSAMGENGQIGMIRQYNEHVFLEALKSPASGTAQFDREEILLEGCLSDEELSVRRKYAGQLHDLFHLPVRETPLSSHIEDVTVHYGLRLLQHIVSVNNGYLMGRTPDGNGRTLVYNNENMLSSDGDEYEPEDSYVTEWSAIIPISDSWPSLPDVNGAEAEQLSYFGSKVLPPRNHLIYVDYETLFDGVTFSVKSDDIITIQKRLNDYLRSQCAGELSDAVVLLNLNQLSSPGVELLAKALFRQIAYVQSTEGNIPLRIALLFPDMDTLHEFIRWYSVFYIDGVQPDMSNVQIALCSNGRADIPCTQTILSGNILSDAQRSAILFAYQHSEYTLEYLPLLNYLTYNNTSSSKASGHVELFPFDLFLPASFPASAGMTSLENIPWGENWFYKRISAALETDMQSSEYGCMIRNTHIRLGSKLHMGQFCEAELLFHNMGNIAYFAYLIVTELLYRDYKVNKDFPLLLLGYEKYSSTLLLQIKFWLENTLEKTKVYSAIVYDGTSDGEVYFKPYFDACSVSYADFANVQVVTVLPVGTTLSTVYKMHNRASKFFLEKREAAARACKAKNDGSQPQALQSESDLSESVLNAPSRNFCLVLINKDLLNSDGNLSDTSARFWERFNSTDHTVVPCAENSSLLECRVKYLIPVNTKWYAPDSCPICKEEGKSTRPIIDVRHSETEPNAIFALHEQRPNGFECLVRKTGGIKANRARIRSLFQNVHYSHMYSANNHFQFYIDFENLFRENCNEIRDLLRVYRTNADAYHVLVVPMQFANSGFVKAVIDVVFQGQVRVLRLNLTDIYREEMRAKFSFIAEDYRRVKRSNPNASFQVHFADSSVVTGNILNRARLLVQMLLEHSGIPYDNVFLFDHLFLLVNRSSYDSANFFVHDPENNFFAYVHLAIPSYNTESDRCPACRTAKKYDLLEKRSSTEQLSSEFERLKEKHRKRSREEYNRDLDEAILDHSSYFSWFVQWLYVNVPEHGKNIGLFSFAREESQERYKRMSATLGITVDDLRKHDYDTAVDVAEKFSKFFETCSYKFQLPNLPTDPEKLYRLRQKYLNNCAKLTIREVVNYVRDFVGQMDAEIFQREVLRIAHRELIGVRSYMRLLSMQKTYELFYEISTGDPCAADYRNRLIKLIAEPLQSTEEAMAEWPATDKAEIYRFCLAKNAEWIISYIKVASREQLVNYYEFRRAITGILDDMLAVMEILRVGDFSNSRIKDLTNESPEWGKIISVMTPICNPKEYNEFCCGKLCVLLQYHMQMILIHRMADLQISAKINVAGVKSIATAYEQYLNTYFTATDGDAGHAILAAHMVLPTSDRMIIRYLKSAKSATMLSNDAVPCLQLTKTPVNLENRITCTVPLPVRENMTLFARYIYLENTQMLYTGMRDLEKSISPKFWSAHCDVRPADEFPKYMRLLDREVVKVLTGCYSNLDGDGEMRNILYQNILGNFCRFWHLSTGSAAATSKEGGGIQPLTYMLQYFRRINYLAENHIIDELPYQYEDLCRTICGLTGFKMCYIVYESDGNYPEIFTQSGYNEKLLKKILKPHDVDNLLRLIRNDGNCLDADEEYKVTTLIPDVSMIQKKNDQDYLVLSISLKSDRTNLNRFHLVLQSLSEEHVFGTDNGSYTKAAMRKARDILFMRESLQLILSRDYTVLTNFRFDCSYIRPFANDYSGHPAVIHISDLHINDKFDGLRDKVKDCIRKTLKSRKIDLLIITGDIVDGREASAPQMEKNYGLAMDLLDGIVSELWMDEDGYLPHDWRRRIIITTGNHDYASMNQYKAVLRRRELTSAMPVESDSSTMSKFAYFIDFLIKYLDAPIDELLLNDLNEVRDYRNLDVKILSLNCSGTAVPHRTNKIGIDEAKVMALVRRKAWKDKTWRLVAKREDDPVSKKSVPKLRRPYRICAAHYSTEYEPSYFLDNYSCMPGWEWDPRLAETCPINGLSDCFCTALQWELQYRVGMELYGGQATATPMMTGTSPLRPIEAKLKTARDDFLKQIRALDNAMQDLEAGHESMKQESDRYYNRLKATAKDGIKKAVEDMRKNDLYNLIKCYEKWINELNTKGNENSAFCDEQISKLIFEVNESIMMSKYDERNYKRIIDKIERETGETIDLFLAGHIHAYAESSKQSGEGKIEHFLVADRLYDPERLGIHGYVILNVSAEEEMPTSATGTASDTWEELLRYYRFGGEETQDGSDNNVDTD